MWSLHAELVETEVPEIVYHIGCEQLMEPVELTVAYQVAMKAHELVNDEPILGGQHHLPLRTVE